jgi:hypothetical protein
MSRQQREKAAASVDEVIEIILVQEDEGKPREEMAKLLKAGKEIVFGFWRSIDGIAEAIENHSS